MTDQQLSDLLERAAGRALMPPAGPGDDARRGEAALRRRRRTLATAAAALTVVALTATAGATALGSRDDGSAPPAGSTPTTTLPPESGSVEDIRQAVAAVLDPSGAHVVPGKPAFVRTDQRGQRRLIVVRLGWREPGGARDLEIEVRVARSTVDAEWGCRGACRTYPLAGGTAYQEPVTDLEQDSTLLARPDGSAVVVTVSPGLLEGPLTRDDVEAVLASDTLTLPPDVMPGPQPVPGATVDRIGLDALPGVALTAPSDDLHPAAAGSLDGAEVLWQADPVARSASSCFWSRCEDRRVAGVRLELSRPPGAVGRFAGWVSVEYQGPVWRTRVLMPADLVPLVDVAALLTDVRWPR